MRKITLLISMALLAGAAIKVQNFIANGTHGNLLIHNHDLGGSPILVEFDGLGGRCDLIWPKAKSYAGDKIPESTIGSYDSRIKNPSGIIKIYKPTQFSKDPYQARDICKQALPVLKPIYQRNISIVPEDPNIVIDYPDVLKAPTT